MTGVYYNNLLWMCTLNLIEMKTGCLIFVKMAVTAQKYEFIPSTIALQKNENKNKNNKQQKQNKNKQTKCHKN